MIIRNHSESPEISVVMAVRNGVTSLAVTMESVLDQDVSALELIVVDDGSEDGSRDVLAAFQKRDKRVKVLLQKPSGLTASLRKGCAIAQGAFIARQDCGDRSLPGRLSKQASILRDSPRVGLVSCFTRYVGPGGEFLYLSDGGVPEGGRAELRSSTAKGALSRGPSHHGSVLFRQDAYLACGGYREAFVCAQDWDLWLRMAEKTKFEMVPEVLYEASVSPTGISMSRKDEQAAYAALLRPAAEVRSSGADEAAWLKDRLSAISFAHPRGSRHPSTGHYFIGSTLLKNRNPACRKYFLRAVQCEPWRIKNWLKLLQSLWGGFR
jgi:glycosyltransferase involved in cell wall biosynthesis